MISSLRFLYAGCTFLISLILFGCISDEESRLRTDLAVEGKEMFDTSFAISEHLYYLLQPFDFYEGFDNDTLQLPGCPIVAVDTVERSVNLTFNPSIDCPNRNIVRAGTISMFYSTSVFTDQELVLVEYEDYMVKESTVEGNRLITKLSDNDASAVLFSDGIASLMVFDEFGSSTRINAELEHQVIYETDTLTQITTTGMGGGRNIAGRSFSFEITRPKIYERECILDNVFIPNLGEERWTFERTVTSAVMHRMNLGDANECDRSVLVILSNGEVLTLSQ